MPGSPSKKKRKAPNTSSNPADKKKKTKAILTAGKDDKTKDGPVMAMHAPGMNMMNNPAMVGMAMMNQQMMMTGGMPMGMWPPAAMQAAAMQASAASMQAAAAFQAGQVAIQATANTLETGTATPIAPTPTEISMEEHKRLLAEQGAKTKDAEAKTKTAEKEAKKHLADLKRAQKKIAKLEAQLADAKQKQEQVKKYGTYFNQNTKLIQPEDGDRDDVQPNHNDIKFQRKYADLQRFKAKHGHCNPSYYDKETTQDFPGLATWVSSQRTYYQWLKAGKPNNLTPYRIHLLNEIGFEWQIGGFDRVEFDDRVVQLQAFKDEFGHTNVQQHYKGVTGLGNWVLTMRRQYRTKKLAQERIDVLNGMDFQWRLRRVKVPGGRNRSSRKVETEEEEESPPQRQEPSPEPRQQQPSPERRQQAQQQPKPPPQRHYNAYHVRMI